MKRTRATAFGVARPMAMRKRARKAPTATAVASALVRRAPGFLRLGGAYGRYGINARQQGLKPELKFFDTANSFLFDSTAEVPATGQVALIPQGDTESTRDGRLAVIKSIQIRGNLLFEPGASAAGVCQAFLYVVLDTQANGAAAAVTDVFTGTNLSTALLNLNNSGRFRILKKFNYNFTSTAGVSTAYNPMVKQLEWYKRCNIKMDWSSTTGAITEIRSNNIFLIAGASQGDDLVTFTGNTRLRFVG